MAEQVPKKIDKKKCLGFVVSEYERYDKAHSERFAKAEIAYNNWVGKAPKRLEHQNAVHVPATFEAEQTITPRIFTALFPNDAPVDVQVEGEVPQEAGLPIKSLIQHYFRVSNVQGEMSSSLTQNTLYGTAYTESGSWLTRRGWVIGPQGERYNTIIEARPDTKHVNFFEIYPHPAKLRVEDGLPLIRRRFCDAEYLKSLKENPFFKFDDIEEALNSKPPVKNDLGLAYEVKPGDVYEMLEYWGPYDENYEKDGKLMTKKAVPYWIIVINRSVIVRSIPNPYSHQLPPFTKTVLFKDAKPSWFGVGIGQVGEATQQRLNKIVNNRLDNVDLILNKMGLYNKNDTLLNKKQFEVSKPGKWIGVSDVNLSAKWMDIPDVTAEAYEEEKIAKQDFREATGATSAMMPSDTQDEQHRTAMGIQLLQGAAGMRFKPVLKNIETDAITAIAMFYFSNCKQFMSAPEWVQITGENGVKTMMQIKPEDIQAKVYFIPTGISETINKETMIGQLLRFKEITINDPTVNRAEINKRIADLMGFKDMDKLIVKQVPIQGGSPLDAQTQARINQRLQEGATPEQVKQEVMGNQPKPVSVTPQG